MKSQINFNKVNKHNSKYTVKNIYQVNAVLSTDFFTDYVLHELQILGKIWWFALIEALQSHTLQYY